ncbi:hypothetical protein CL615_04595 [archaeon]|jgi:ferredoxin|nr:hypothetical protein [archaeon]MDP6548075.1 DUF4346 domain-containing protein [Candidatus Woesearchaeota archaeon]|tara:strand:+ start:96 stop:698 length:603 start_codon:yes stop_codon:yes gene_type:complete
MAKLHIEYNKNTCIGQGSCVALAPDYFEFEGSKAILKESDDIGKGIYTLEVDSEPETADALIEAAKGCPVNAIRVIDPVKGADIVGNKVNDEEGKEVIAEYDDAKEFVVDDKGYFLIKVNNEKNKIEVAFCNEKNKIVLKVTGEKPLDIYQTILNKEKLDIRMDHAAYLGRELEKAYIALKNNLAYVQDDELDLNKKVSQ